MIALIFLSLFLLLFLSVPIFICLAVIPFLVFALFTQMPLSILPQRMFAGIDSFPLMAIPFFVFAANIMGRGGISERLINFVNSLVGHFRGGMAMCAVVACALFGAVTGSSASTLIAVGGILYPALTKAGYSEGFAIGVIASSAMLGMIIPPSNAMIIYGSITGVSVGALFLSGFGAGMVFVAIYCLYSYIYARKKNIPILPRAKISEILQASKKASWALGMPVIIIGGIYSGVFTPTESAAVAVIYSSIVCIFVQRTMKLTDYWQTALGSAIATAKILILVSAASLFSWLLTVQGVTGKLIAPIVQADPAPWKLLLFSNVGILLAGMFVDVFSNLLIIVPILINPITASGISALHFGIVATVNSDMGNITPPFGLNIFVASGAFQKSYVQVVKALLPWMVLSIIALMLITYLPQISLWLPMRMYPGIR